MILNNYAKQGHYVQYVILKLWYVKWEYDDDSKMVMSGNTLKECKRL